jgi:hypothetical protein
MWLFEVHNSATIRINAPLLGYQNTQPHDHKKTAPVRPEGNLRAHRHEGLVASNDKNPLFNIVWPSINECPNCFETNASVQSQPVRSNGNGAYALDGQISWNFEAIEKYLESSFLIDI